MSSVAVLGAVHLTVSVLLAVLCAVDMDRRGLWGLDRRGPPPA
jgi:hypothetical protein